MIKIRNGVFETNSSSVHSLCIAPEDEFIKWKNGELIYNCYRQEFFNPDEINMKDYDGWERDEFYTYDDFFHNWERMDYDTYHTDYTTKSGDKIVIFGYYGHD